VRGCRATGTSPKKVGCERRGSKEGKSEQAKCGMPLGRDSPLSSSKIRRQARPSNAKENPSNSKNPTDIMHRTIVRPFFHFSRHVFFSLALLLTASMRCRLQYIQFKARHFCLTAACIAPAERQVSKSTAKGHLYHTTIGSLNSMDIVIQCPGSS
jgi:hypothetical protein